MRLAPVRHGVLWVGLINVGTGRGQTQLTANFDTGAIDTIIHPGQYPFLASSSARYTGKVFQLEYSDGTTAQGRVMLETVSLARLQALDVAIGDSTISTVNADESQAIVGMASLMPPGVSALRRPGLIPTLFAQGSIERRLVCFGLWKDETARLDIGHIAPMYRGRISWTPVLNPEYGIWASSFAISGVAEPQVAIVDTGTSLIIGPYELVFRVIIAAGLLPYEQDGHIHGMYPTNGPRPFVAIHIAGLQFVLTADSLAYQEDGAFTIVGIVGKQGQSGWWVLGDVFLQNVYAVFDTEGRRIGFASR
ncbi:hypothetical protein V8E36_008835 [Tilletia maclaganii]